MEEHIEDLFKNNGGELRIQEQMAAIINELIFHDYMEFAGFLAGLQVSISGLAFSYKRELGLDRKDLIA